MIPQNISFEDFDGCSQSASLFDKTTQTSETIIRESTAFILPRHKNRKTINGCEANAESAAIGSSNIKKLSSCEILKTVLSERYNYCQEVLRPYLKKFSSEYSNNVEDKDRFIDAIADDDFCHAKSCKIICPGDTEKAMSPRDKNDRSKCKVRNEPEASCSVNAACPDEPLEKDSCCCCNNEPPCVQRPKCPPPRSECEKKPNVCDKTMKEANECNLKKCVTKCVRDTVKTIKRDQSHCETVIGYIPSKDPSDKTIFYPFNRLKERGAPDCPLKKSSVQEKLESSSATLSNMTSAVGSFICKVYNKTKEVVGLAATNSCKHLGLSNEETHAQDCESHEKIQARDSESKESCCKRSKKKNCSVTKCLFQDDDDTRAEFTDNIIESVGASTEIVEPASQMIEQICSTVKKSFSSISGSFKMENLVDVVTFPKPDRSSKYDVPTPQPAPPQIAHIPTPTPPKQLSQGEITPVHSGMVKSVANKICSIFQFGRKGSASSIPAEQVNDPQKELQNDKFQYETEDKTQED